MEHGKSEKSRRNLGLYIGFIIIAFLIIAAFVFLYTPTTQNTGQVGSTNDTESAPRARLVLTTDKDSYVVGEDILVKVLLESSVEIAGVDVSIYYDPNILDISDDAKVALDTSAPADSASLYLLANVSVFEQVPFAEIIEGDKENTFNFSAIASPQGGFSGDGVVGTFKMRALSRGVATIDFVFDGIGVPTDTNVAFEGIDILDGVQGATITIN